MHQAHGDREGDQVSTGMTLMTSGGRQIAVKYHGTDINEAKEKFMVLESDGHLESHVSHWF